MFCVYVYTIIYILHIYVNVCVYIYVYTYIIYCYFANLFHTIALAHTAGERQEWCPLARSLLVAQGLFLCGSEGSCHKKTIGHLSKKENKATKETTETIAACSLEYAESSDGFLICP